MLFMLTALIAITAGFIGYAQSRRFVASRLRYVDAAQNRLLPFLAGFGATLLALPLVFFLPFIGGGTAVILGLGVGTGVAVGAKDVRLARYKID
jgi:hypothetical protein